MTSITSTDTICDRCDHDLQTAVDRHLDEGGPGQCPMCGLGFDVADDYLADNGYNYSPDWE